MSDSGSESDIEIQRQVMKKSTKKPPKSPDEHLKRDPKKLTTKDMVHSALKELNTRKGVSLYAIKKYMVERYNVDTDKINYYIKKYIKTGVESGVIMQTKGIGASGSFKLAPNMDKKKKKPMKKMEKSDKPEKKEKSEKIKKKSAPSDKTEKKLSKKSEDKLTKKKESTKSTKDKEKMVKITKEKPSKEGKAVKVAKKVKTSKNSKMATETPAKKRTIMMKRKSIGSIIKPPKMKPK
ncbi:histone H1.1, embryonic-like [Pectinophora gossypiella]|uniref:histone H1.1, embryonic-like n=1 Tax=Pectinophora gossypiella TaxID=13191 RepID=UPI00214EA88B|nr:histone H1.1, embryonic-like [Pectinophora gossypiella]